MLKGFIDFFTPKGELRGPSFLLNYIILRLLGAIVSYIGLYITFNKYNQIPAVQFFTYLLLGLSLFLVITLAFNYKRRLLNITGNLTVSIILALIFTFGMEIVLTLIFFNVYIFLIYVLIIPLIVSVLPPKDSDKKEYAINFKNKTFNFFKNPITIFVIIMTIIDFGLVKLSVYKNVKISKLVPDKNFEELSVNPLTSFTGKTKDEILSLRTDFVKKSIFANDKYKPNEDVFGKIEDKKPWWGIDYITCTDNDIPTSKRKEGDSEESRFINNPNVLVGIQLNKSYIKNSANQKICNDKSLLFIPKSIYYDKSNKLIIVKYNPSKNILEKINGAYFIKLLLVGLNARDFGYNWIYVSNSNNLMFLPEILGKKMVNEKPQKLYDHIHLGNACQVEGGCNNSSPYQPSLSFEIKQLPANMTISLWKSKPIYKNQPADFYMKIIFE